MRLSGAVSRRRFLKLVGVAGGTSALAGLLAACGSSSSTPAATTAASSSSTTTTSGGAATTTTSSSAGAATPASSGAASPASTTAAATQAAATQAAAAPGKAGGSLTYAIWQNPDTLDPGASGLIATSKIAINVFDPLIYATQDAAQPYNPGLATKWDASADATQFTFTLRQGVKFHDGTAFDATAVKRTFDHIVDPATKSLGGVSALNPNGIYDNTEVVDASTVRVHFKAANGAFLNQVTAVTLAPVSPAALDKYGADFGLHPVGTGPFVFKEWVKQDHVTITKNPDYNWAPSVFKHTGQAYLDQITFRIVPEASTRAVTLENGEVDMTEELTPDDFTRLTKGGQFQPLRIKTTGMPYCMMINVTKAPTDDLAVRQAMEYATDQKSIVDTLYAGIYDPAHAPIDPTTLGFDKSLESMYSFDKNKAMQVLDAAGWKAGSDGMRSKDGKPLQILFINLAGFGFDGIAQLLQAQFKDIGMKMDITEQSFPAVQDTYQRGDHNMAPFFLYAIDPSYVNGIYATDAIKVFNWMHYSNPDVDKMIQDGLKSTDPAVRGPIYVNINKQVMQDAIIIPIYYKLVVLAAKPAVKGLSYTINGFPFFYDTTVK